MYNQILTDIKREIDSNTEKIQVLFSVQLIPTVNRAAVVVVNEN